MGTPAVGRLYYNIADFLGIMHLAADQAEDELMVLFQQCRRIDQVTFRSNVQDIRDCDLRFDQFFRVGLHLKFGFLAALNHYGGDT